MLTDSDRVPCSGREAGRGPRLPAGQAAGRRGAVPPGGAAARPMEQRSAAAGGGRLRLPLLLPLLLA